MKTRSGGPRIDLRGWNDSTALSVASQLKLLLPPGVSIEKRRGWRGWSLVVWAGIAVSVLGVFQPQISAWMTADTDAQIAQLDAMSAEMDVLITRQTEGDRTGVLKSFERLMVLRMDYIDLLPEDERPAALDEHQELLTELARLYEMEHSDEQVQRVLAMQDELCRFEGACRPDHP